MFILITNMFNAINFCMWLPILLVVALTYYFIITNEQRPNHRIWRNIACSKLCKLKATMHIYFVISHL